MSENLPVRTHATAREQIGAAAPDVVAMLRVLETYMDASFEEALECAGDEPATFDECENDGAQQAWGEARDLVRYVLEHGRAHPEDSEECHCHLLGPFDEGACPMHDCTCARDESNPCPVHD